MKQNRTTRFTRILAAALVLSMALCLTAALGATAYAEDYAAENGLAGSDSVRPDTRLIIDNQLMSFHTRPIVVNQKPLLPVRAICEYYGATVTWDAAHKQALVEKNGRKFTATGALSGGVLMVSTDFFQRMLSMETVFYPKYNIIAMSTAGAKGLPSEWDALEMTPSYRTYTRDDLTWLAKIVEAEACDESFASRLGVANVVLNRKNTDGFPSTIKEVIFDRSAGVQFTPTANGAINNKPTGESYLAAVEALEGKNNASTTLFFFNPRYATSNWISRNREYAFTIGGHNYYY